MADDGHGRDRCRARSDVPARDGVVLATDVYRPTGPGPFPVLFERSLYHKSAPSRAERTAAVAPRSRTEIAAYFVGHGYAVAYQDCRGPLSFGRPFHEISERGRGRLRRTRLAPAPGPGATAVSAPSGCPMRPTPQAALGCLDAPGLTAQFLDCGGFSNAYRSGIRLAAARSEAGDMGLSQCPCRCPRPGGEGGPGSAGHPGLVPSHALA